MGEGLPKSMWRTGEENLVKGYMCLIAWECELGGAHGGNRIYPSIEDLKDHHAPWKSCGIVEVSIAVTRVVHEGNSDDDTED